MRDLGILIAVVGALLLMVPSNAVERIDVAQFGRVATWDPSRMDGARMSRVEEFRAEDLFLETELLPEPDGSYAVPVSQDGRGCIGVEWVERRRLAEIGLQLSEGADPASMQGVEVQHWVGQSRWQGGWQPLEGKLKQDGSRLVLGIEPTGDPAMETGTWKIRWILPKSSQQIAARRIWAYTEYSSQTAEITIQLEKPLPGKTAELEMYNGTFVGASGDSIKQTWDLGKPVRLTVRHTEPKPWKPDRTVIMLRLPGASFGVAVDDLLENDSIYVREAGVFVVKEPAKVTLQDYAKSIAGKKTILERVREMPDQTLAQAMEKTRNPVQDNGPMMLSLACDHNKFIANRDGTIIATERSEFLVKFPFGWMKTYDLMKPTFGSGKNEGLTRRLEDGWIPVHVNSVREGGVTYTQRTCVAPFGDESFPESIKWLNNKPLCLVEFTMESAGADSGASLRLDFTPGMETDQVVTLHELGKGIIAQLGERLLAWVDLAEAGPVEARIDGSGVVLSGQLPQGKNAPVFVYIPAWEMKPEEYDQLTGGESLIAKTHDYWKRVMAPAAQIELPDQFIQDLIRASQVHCMLAARNDGKGETVAAYASSTCYGPLESEANSIITAMILMGQEEFARRSLDYFIARYKPEGYLTTGYTLLGTGWHLWALGDYYRLYRNTPWLEGYTAKVDRICQWIAAQCEKTKKLDPRGEKVPEYGLIPPGVQADWDTWCYHFSLSGYYYVGLKRAAKALAEIGVEDAKRLDESAEDLRNNILRAYRYMRARTPVLALQDGTWVPGYPSQVFIPGPLEYFYPGEDANRSWCYDVELGAHQMVPHGILELDSPEVTDMMDHMEDVQFLGEGWFDYPKEKNKQDWYNLGGFSKVQPYYTRNAEIYAMQDDVKPFVRSYFNTLVSLVSTENMSFWEHFHCIAAWNKTHETGYFLQQSRFMLIMEHGKELWLAPLVTNNWLKDGMVISVKNAPTEFGQVSYRITSHVAQGYIEATIDPPTRNEPSEIVIRLRHPEDKPIRSVTINGKPHAAFSPRDSTIRIKPCEGSIEVKASY